MTLRDFLASRGISQSAAAVLAGVAESTIWRVLEGQTRAHPQTIVKLAKALGVSASRMRAMCEAHWVDAHPDERVPA